MRIPSLSEHREIFALYGSRFNGGNAYYWSTTAAGPLKVYVENLVTGVETSLKVIYNANIIGIA